MAYRMRLPEQFRRSPTFDIRSCVHTGIDFDMTGHFTPMFNGVVYIMVPQWANMSSIDDLTKIKMNLAGQEIDLSHLDVSRIDTSKLKFQSTAQPESNVAISPSEPISAPSTSWFDRWFRSTPAPPSPPPQATVAETPLTPVSRTTPLEELLLIVALIILGELLLVQRLIDTFALSDDAKKYVIADQLESACGPWPILSWIFVAGSFFLPFSLYTRLRTHFKTRLKRYLFFHFLLFNGFLCFYFAPFGGRLINMQVSRLRDDSTASYGLDLLEGGIEYLEKQLERNRILRELLPRGKDLFDVDGERRKTLVPIPYSDGLTIPLHHWNPLIGYRLKRLRAKLDSLMNLPEADAKKTIFKPMVKVHPLQENSLLK